MTRTNGGRITLYLGELEQAEEEYRRAGRSSGSRVHEGATGGVPASALQALAELYALALQPESARGLFYAGRFALQDGDIEAAARRLETLSALPASSTSESVEMYAVALEAEIDLYRGHVVEAVENLEGLVSSGKLVADWPTTCSSVGAVFRESLVRAYLSSGHKEKAARALEGLITSGFERVDHPAIYVRALYRLGALKMDAGDLEGGRHLLERFLEHWGASTWELPEVDDAKRRIR
jgi:tetratricopeptide (TPR) repeat protein